MQIVVAIVRALAYTSRSCELFASERIRTRGMADTRLEVQKGATRKPSARAKFSQRTIERECILPARNESESKNSVPLVEKIQSVLASKRLSLYRVSQQSAALYGRSSAFFIPHNFYSDLRTSFMPSLHQVAALSRISGYRLIDWLAVFGFNLEDIVRLQILLPSKRTILLDTSLDDANDSIPWFRNRTDMAVDPPIAPLVQLLQPTPPRKISSLSRSDVRSFLYAKVGYEDGFAFPELAPGSIVRVDPSEASRDLFSDVKPERIFLIEHSRGLCCCAIRPLSRDMIVPIGISLPYARVALRVPTEVRILGAMDLEIRWLVRVEQPTVTRDLARRWKPQLLVTYANLGQRLQRSRSQMNLSLREVAAFTRRIAEMSGNPHYRISASSLYDYEQSADTPRDFRKIASLCAIYGLNLRIFLQAMGIKSQEEASEPIPDSILRRQSFAPSGRESSSVQHAGFLEHLQARLGDIPVFLRNSLDTLSGSSKIAFDDFYWIGGEHTPLHPYLVNGLLAIVNRRRKTAFHFASKPLWEQPIYLILKRDGEYLAACCGAENGTLVIHPYGPEFFPPLVFRNHQDAEVIGQFIAVLRNIR